MPRRLALIATSIAALLALCAAPASASRLYVPAYNDNAIAAYDVGADGALTPLPGSPFGVALGALSGNYGYGFGPGGRGAVGFYFEGGAQGLAVGPFGAIAPAGAPIPTASVESLAVSPDGRFAYGATREFKGLGPEGIRAFSLAPDGALAPAGAFGAGWYVDVAMSRDGRYLFASQSGQIQRFSVGADGALTPLGATEPPGADFVATLSLSPDGRFLFADTWSAATRASIFSYAIGADGSLTQNGDPVAAEDFPPRYLAVSPDGNRLYVPERNFDLIRTVSVAPDGRLAPLAGTLVEDAHSVAVTPDGRFLYWFTGTSVRGAALDAQGVPSSLLPVDVPLSSSTPGRLLFQPGPAPVARVATQPAPPGAPTRFDATASSDAARFDWDFGDGTTLADGGPSPAHVYAAPGAYTVTLSVVDAGGCGAAQIYTGQSTICPGSAAATATATVDTLPRLDRLKAVPRAFLPKGARSKRRGKPCPRFASFGHRSIPGRAGANRYRFNGRMKGRPLPAGSFRVTAVATDAAGGRSAPVKTFIKVKRR